MAKYTVVHSCNHEEHLELFGPLKDRAYRLAQLRQSPCRDCVLSWLEGLAVLSGTPGQTAWAESIRRRLITADPLAQLWPGPGEGGQNEH